MKRMFVLVSLLLPGLMGCASDKDLQAMRADAQALERQSSERQQTVEARLQSVNDRVAQFEKSQAEARRDLARTAATLDELRIQLQRLQGDIQETQHRVRRGTTGGEGISATKLADFEKGHLIAKLNRVNVFAGCRSRGSRSAGNATVVLGCVNPIVGAGEISAPAWMCIVISVVVGVEMIAQ